MTNKEFFIPGKLITLKEESYRDIFAGQIVEVHGCDDDEMKGGRVIAKNGIIVNNCHWAFWNEVMPSYPFEEITTSVRGI